MGRDVGGGGVGGWGGDEVRERSVGLTLTVPN
jgi:hypothetical protein